VRAVSLKLVLAKSSHEIHRAVGVVRSLLGEGTLTRFRQGREFCHSFFYGIALAGEAGILAIKP